MKALLFPLLLRYTYRTGKGKTLGPFSKKVNKRIIRTEIEIWTPCQTRNKELYKILIKPKDSALYMAFKRT
jgi:hypothetical protein